MTTPGPTEDLIQKWAVSLQWDGRSEYTVREWSGIVRHADRDLPHGLEESERDEIRAWLAQYQGWTRMTYYSALRSFFRWATDPADLWLVVDPMQAMKPPSTPDSIPNPCSDGQLQAILDDYREPYYTWALLGAYAGMRCFEIGTMRREYATETSLRIHGKGGRWRTVPMHPAIWEQIRDLPSGPVARKVRDGYPACGRYISSKTNVYCHKAMRMPDMHWHRLRHWYGTKALEACGDPRVVQELLGHASLATTQRYTHVTEGRRRNAVLGIPTPELLDSSASGGPTASHAPE